MKNADYGKSLISNFQKIFDSIQQMFILGRTLGNRLSLNELYTVF